MQNKPNSDYTTRLNMLSTMLSYHIDDILYELKLDLKKTGKLYTGVCPIHKDADNPLALNLYPNGHTVPGYWRCNTKGCQNVFVPNLLGFIRGTLSHPFTNRKVPFCQAVELACKITGQKLNEIKIDKVAIDRLNFINQYAYNQNNHFSNKLISRETIRSKLTIPAEPFIKEGFARDILDKYDVGLSANDGKELSNRIVVPIYDDDHKFAVGFTARSIHPKCEHCNLYHISSCPTTPLEKMNAAKWICSSGAKVHNFLYNYWFAKESIITSRSAFLVEGPKEVWKLAEAGITNSVAMLGTQFTSEQESILARSGVMNLYVIPDNDEAGKACGENISSRYKRYYNLRFIPLSGVKDIGEMSTADVRNLIKGYIRGI